MSEQLPVIRIVDKNFAHGVGLGCGDLNIPPTKFNYYRGDEQVGDIVLVTDNCLNQVGQLKEKIKIAWLLEPPCINSALYNTENIMLLLSQFNLILTHQKDIIKINPKKILFYPYGGCWIYPKDWRVYKKSKQTSIIVSGKRETSGHILRHEVVEKFRDKIDVYGNAYNRVEYKLTALQDYRYSIVIENENSDYWFTEKLIDCFATGTVPIYFGCPSIHIFCNEKGIIKFKNITELNDILNSFVSETDYKSRLVAIKDNFQHAKQYAIPEDYLFGAYLKNFIKRHG